MTQLDLFGAPVPGKGEIAPAPPSDHAAALGARLPQTVRLGTSSWSFPGWRGLVWAGDHGEGALSRRGLTAYGQHPLLRTVGVDRTHYAPVSAEVLRGYAEQVPSTFRFLVKAHEALSLAVFPGHPRYGAHRGQPSPHFLDPAYARDAVVGPFVDGLGARGGVLLFQFAPQPVELLGGSPRRFAERLYRFLRDLPSGPTYAVEVRTPSLLTADYAAALRSAGAVHCIGLTPGMPSATAQQAMRDPTRPLVARWLLAPGWAYDDARAQFAPFDRLVAPDVVARRELATIIADAVARAVPTTVIVNNKAEGSAPRSIEALAEALLDEPGF
ncbi:MAG: DUF72 domain-containing protein [Kofleriaceae bacterium]